MKIVIAGLPKSGTTALYFKIKNSVSESFVCLFEPKEYKKEAEQQNVLVKLLIGKSRNLELEEILEKFDKKILIVRDPRDQIISSFLYSIRHFDIYKNDEKLEKLIDILKIKEKDPNLVSVLSLFENLHCLEGMKFDKDVFLNQKKFFLRRGSDFYKQRKDYFLIKYEDFIDGNISSLEKYLGFMLPGPPVVSDDFKRVERTKSYGDWKNWFVPQDVEFFKKAFDDYMKEFQYADRWDANEKKVIMPRFSSLYVRGIVRQKIEEDVILMKDAELRTRDKIIGEKLAIIQEKNALIEEKDQDLNVLESRLREKESESLVKIGKFNEISLYAENLKKSLDNIESSITWMAVKKVQTLLDKIFPKESFWGRRYYKVLSKFRGAIAGQKKAEENIKFVSSFVNLREAALAVFNYEFPSFKAPVVSIIILTRNKHELTLPCLSSIQANTDVPYEVIIVDNASVDETKTLLSRLKNVRIIRNKENLGFGAACNQGAEIATGKYLLFLNNDTVVTLGWLENLVRTAESNPLCGAVGSKLIWPNGKLQEAGNIIFNDGSVLGYGRDCNPNSPEFCHLREVDYCSGACLLVKKQLFDDINGFDNIYRPATYEDSDLAMEIRKRGFLVFYQPESIVFHHEFGTVGSQSLAAKLHEANKPKFVEKWKNELQNYPGYDEIILSCRDRKFKKRILFVDDRIPDPTQGSGFPRAYSIIKILNELGYKITLFPLQDATGYQTITQELQQAGIEVFFGKEADFAEFAEKRAHHYDVIIISRPHNIKQVLSYVKKYFKNSFLIYDAEALFSVRDTIKAVVDGKIISETTAKKLIAEEVNLAKSADIVIAVSELERKNLIDGGARNVRVLGHGITRKAEENSGSFRDRTDILFVGGNMAPGSPNEDAILFFARKIFPNLQKKFNCMFHIIGRNDSESLNTLSSDSVIFHGYVPDLSGFYDKCRVFVVPHRFSGGIPYKLHEAMANGIPSVISSLTANQLGFNEEKNVLIANGEKEFIEKTVELYENEELWESIRRNAFGYLAKECNFNKFSAELINIINLSIKV